METPRIRQNGKTCIKITYNGQGDEGAPGGHFCSIRDNWGEKAGGYDLSAYKRAHLLARGNDGGEKVRNKPRGGITGEHGIRTRAPSSITLTKDWKKYTIRSGGQDLSHNRGRFCWFGSRDDNPNGLSSYLDEIRVRAVRFSGGQRGGVAVRNRLGIHSSAAQRSSAAAATNSLRSTAGSSALSPSSSQGSPASVQGISSLY